MKDCKRKWEVGAKFRECHQPSHGFDGEGGGVSGGARSITFLKTFRDVSPYILRELDGTLPLVCKSIFHTTLPNMGWDTNVESITMHR